MDYVTVRLMHEISNYKEKESNVRMLLWCYDKAKAATYSHAETSCFDCNKLSHIAHFCYKTKSENCKDCEGR